MVTASHHGQEFSRAPTQAHPDRHTTCTEHGPGRGRPANGPLLQPPKSKLPSVLPAHPTWAAALLGCFGECACQKQSQKMGLA